MPGRFLVPGAQLPSELGDPSDSDDVRVGRAHLEKLSRRRSSDHFDTTDGGLPKVDRVGLNSRRSIALR
jgi:hypothetical protein